MPLDLMNMPAEEAEALAYAEGFPGTARLFARIADLQKALGESVAEIEALKDELTVARWERAFPGNPD